MSLISSNSLISNYASEREREREREMCVVYVYKCANSEKKSNLGHGLTVNVAFSMSHDFCHGPFGDS